ncbi:transcription factor [Ganoderma sinense ZZ0214-1]|uniref:Transcription factor n=1 Tax=Ganoderma sinense ZZ0214-1 TaxID=1077348 RepID=A0A2G8SIG8_9APHY|nr:transcription factor [Ganoderma sinense ZZ0214-1]
MADIHQINPDPSSHTDSHSNVKIPTLIEDGSNWILYKAQFLTDVQSKGLRRYLEGRERLPKQPTAPGVDSDADERYETALDKWTGNHATIKSLLLQTVPESLKLDIATKTRADEAWQILTSKYDNQGDFMQLHCEEGADPRPVLTHLARLRSEYATAGGVLPDDQYKVHILAILPSSYRPAIRAIQASARSAQIPLTPTALIEAITEIAHDEHAMDGDATNPSAMAACNIECYNCHREGHTKAECWSKGGGREGQGLRRRGKGKGKDSRKGGASNKSGESANVAQGSVQAGTSDNSNTLHAYTFWEEESASISIDFSNVSAQRLPIDRFTRLLDSGASCHFEPCRENFLTFRNIEPIPIQSADGRTFHAPGEGDVRIALSYGTRGVNEFTLCRVLYAPSMPVSLISVSCLANAGFQVHFSQDGCHLTSPAGNLSHTIPARQGLYHIRGVEPVTTPQAPETAAATLSDLEFHCRMGHAYPPILRKMIADGAVTGVELDSTAETRFCEVCQQAKQARELFPKARSSPPPTRYGQRVHTDVWGKATVRTWDRKEYYITFLDDYSDEAVVSLMRNKSDALARYRAYEAWVKVHRGVTAIEELQSDRGGEYTGHEFTAHLESQGTVRRLTVHDSPQQNGKGERLNRTTAEHARALLFDARLPKFLWGEAVLHSTWCRNRTTSKNTPGSTPHKLATGEKPDLSQLPRFSATVWVHQEGVGKLDPKSKPGRWVGFDLESKGHRIYWPECRTVSVECNVRFEPEDGTTTTVGTQLEGEHIPDDDLRASTPPPQPNSEPNVQPNKTPSSSDPPSTPSISPPQPSEPSPPIVTPEPPNEPSPRSVPEPPRPKHGQAESSTPETTEQTGHPKRNRRPTQWIRDLQAGVGTMGGRGALRVPKSILGDSARTAVQHEDERELEGELSEESDHGQGEPEDHGGCADEAAVDGGAHHSKPSVFALAAMSSDDEPPYRDAMAGPDREKWREAMEEELDRIAQMDTYELVEAPPGANVVSSVWALRKKRDENNIVTKFKARLCAQGFSQIPGVDFDKTASLTARPSSFRLVLALANANDWEIHQIDFKNAYLNGDLDETIYMRQP